MKRRRWELPAESGAPLLWALVVAGVYVVVALVMFAVGVALGWWHP